MAPIDLVFMFVYILISVFLSYGAWKNYEDFDTLGDYIITFYYPLNFFIECFNRFHEELHFPLLERCKKIKKNGLLIYALLGLLFTYFKIIGTLIILIIAAFDCILNFRIKEGS